ncbi:hypothetical protein TVAG_395300 [Trichomonas vaginalis G3]|uniref:Uncharacterized protein n=1 Tax=Trichomonas vaginalis (strain ATCC PRA-98 / G3) TaxID=412133 RepID=A2F1B9_TRIV3|nr:papain family cysteine protease domain containing protein family [Trichomonas vaginalis G3]EAY01283.1 hypothetical protein TVAG_395300 [Trichomonas vaginalis G3]KAI5542811.1 papain family cysteine protease domain containing protein family [Trichomonas vaginalis G3]|eukprot:XP_001314090.1 hypothetical protein [Trichomonas vaginalis G3]
MLTQSDPIILIPTENFEIPEYYSVDKYYDVPVKDTKSYGFSWISAFISYMESIYRYQFTYSAIESLKSQYLEMSELFLMNKIATECPKVNSTKACQYIKSVNQKEGSLTLIPNLLNHSADVLQGLAPNSICKNIIENCNASNQKEYIKFDFNLTGWSTHVKDIKRLLIRYQRPLLFAMPEPLHQKYTLCAENDNTEPCKSKTVICPDSTDENPFYCKVTTDQSYTPSGEFFVPPYLQAGDPMNFVIVGYSDTFTPSCGKIKVDYMKYPSGGFIVRPAKSISTGNTINYFTGELSGNEAFKLCPNSLDPKNWIGVDISCMKSKNNFDLCPAIPSTVDYATSVPVTKLKCIDYRYCSENGTYSLIQVPTDPERTTLIVNGVVKVLEHINGTSKVIDIDQIPIERLNQVFTPENVAKNDDSCGNWFIPYEIVDRMSRISTKYLDRTFAFDLEVKFDTNSLPQNAQKFKQSNIKNSLHQAPKR